MGPLCRMHRWPRRAHGHRRGCPRRHRLLRGLGESDPLMNAQQPAQPAQQPKLGPYDWRDDPMGTVIAVPEVRGRFMRFEPGKVPGGPGSHNHEESGGVEIFVVLEGTMAFEIEGEVITATSG